MNPVVRRILKVMVPVGLLALLSAALFGGYLTVSRIDWLQLVAREIQAVCRDAGTQWMVVACLLSYFVTFLILERRLNSTPHLGPLPDRGGEGGMLARFAFSRGQVASPDFWLLGFVVFVLLRYAVDYTNAAKSLQMVILLTGIVVGKGVALWAGWGSIRGKHSTFNSQHPTPNTTTTPSSILNLPSSSRPHTILFALTSLLAAVALWQPDIGMEFHYRGIRRWEGVWDNPNTYGLLMGVGLVLAGGLTGAGVWRLGDGEKHSTSKSAWLCLAACPCAAILCGYGLLKSYSRGAWLGAACGLGFLVWSWINRTHLTPALSPRPTGGEGELRLRVSWLLRNWLPISVLLISSFALCFWQFRHTESPLLRRVFSVGNVNDFSWRNRVTAWQGAGRMMLEKPLAGFGWGRAEEVYRKEYRAERLEETAAIQLNDYLMLGTSAGVPALVCLLIYISLAGCQVSRVTCQERTLGIARSVTRHPPPEPICFAGALVLLIGFWFDGGLFKLPTCVVFWILLELARAPLPSLSPPDGEKVAAKPGEGTSLAKRARRSGAPRWLAGILGLAALGLTTLHLGTPQLAVSKRTLSLARQWLVPPRERADFEYLAAKNIWSGQPLKVLLVHVELANYNRTLVNWKLEDQVYREYVLSPEIDPAFDGDVNWRRPLWEYFYPRIRRETSLEAAAGIVGRQLHERVRISEGTNVSTDMKTIWQRQIATTAALERVYVAALRAAGIPARLSSSDQAEFWNGGEWKLAPQQASANDNK